MQAFARASAATSWRSSKRGSQRDTTLSARSTAKQRRFSPCISRTSRTLEILIHSTGEMMKRHKSTFSVAASPAKRTPTPRADSRATLVKSAQNCLISSSCAGQLASSSKASKDQSVQKMVGTTAVSCEGSGKPATKPRRPAWTLDLSARQYDPSVSGQSAFSVLREEAAARYSLSRKAMRGVLRRARRRGAVLPPALERALISCIRRR